MAHRTTEVDWLIKARIDQVTSMVLGTLATLQALAVKASLTRSTSSSMLMSRRELTPRNSETSLSSSSRIRAEATSLGFWTRASKVSKDRSIFPKVKQRITSKTKISSTSSSRMKSTRLDFHLHRNKRREGLARTEEG